MGSNRVLQLDVTLNQTVLQTQHAVDCVWLWRAQPLPAYSATVWPFCCVLPQPSEPTLLLRNSTTSRSASIGAWHSSSPDYRVLGWDSIVSIKTECCNFGGGWFLFQPNVIFSHLPHFLASHRSPPRWNAVGLTWVSCLRDAFAYFNWILV